jgi:CDP-diacylglycerol--serine O-phosphatidyltransferase
MKMSGLSWSQNKYKFIFLILAIVLLAFIKFAAIPIILILYILFSQIHFKTSS